MSKFAAALFLAAVAFPVGEAHAYASPQPPLHFDVTQALVTPWGTVPGVTANDNIDDTGAVLLYLLLKDNCFLDFPDGVVDLDTNAVPFNFSGKNSLALSGSLGSGRTVFRFHGFDPAIHGHTGWHPGSAAYHMGIHFDTCGAISVNGIDVQSKRHPITESTLTSLNTTLHTATLRIDDPDLFVPYTGTAHMTNGSGTFNEPHGNPFWIGWVFARRPVVGPFPGMVRNAAIYHQDSLNLVVTASAPSGTPATQTVTLDYSGLSPWVVSAIDNQWTVGDIVQLLHQPDDFAGTAWSFRSCGPVSVQDCEITAAAGFACFTWFCSNVTTDNVRVIPQKPTWHMTTTRDGIDSWSSTGTATVSNCLVAFTGDDAMSQDGGHWWRVHSTSPSTQELKLEYPHHSDTLWSRPIFTAGASIEISDMNLLPLATAQIATPPVTTDFSGYYVKLTVNAPPSSSFWTQAVTDRPVRLPNSTPSSLTVQNCTIIAPRGYGLMVADNCSVDQCIFVSVPDTPLLAGNAYSLTAWYNGTQARNNVSLTNNLFYECSEVINSWPYPASTFRSTDSSVITVTSLHKPSTSTVLAASPNGAISNITIQGNTIIGCNGSGIHVTSASTVLIDNNSFQDVSRQYLTSTLTVPEAYLVFLENCAFTTVTNNTGFGPYNHNLGTVNSTYTASGNTW